MAGGGWKEQDPGAVANPYAAAPAAARAVGGNATFRSGGRVIPMQDPSKISPAGAKIQADTLATMAARYNPAKPLAASSAGDSVTAPTDPISSAPPTGTESGPGILESWFQKRASGTDPAYEYSLGRGMDAIDSRMAAGGSFNSGARGQQLSDFGANMGAQREARLDSLAGGASGEHQGRLNSMFQQMLGISGGMSGLAGAYDTTAANGMSAADNAILQMMLNKAGVEGKADQALLNNLFSAFAASQGGK